MIICSGGCVVVQRLTSAAMHRAKITEHVHRRLPDIRVRAQQDTMEPGANYVSKRLCIEYYVAVFPTAVFDNVMVGSSRYVFSSIGSMHIILRNGCSYWPLDAVMMFTVLESFGWHIKACNQNCWLAIPLSVSEAVPSNLKKYMHVNGGQIAECF